MSLNYEHVGIPIAMVLSKSDNKQPRIICLQDYDGDAKTSFKEIKLDNNNEYFQSIGDPKQERSINYIIGRSGSGKSYYIKQWIQQYYKKLYKKRDVYLFSLLEKLISFFNSETGILYKANADLQILINVISNTFRQVKIEDIKNNLQIIKANLSIQTETHKNCSIIIDDICSQTDLNKINVYIQKLSEYLSKVFNRFAKRFLETIKVN